MTLKEKIKDILDEEKKLQYPLGFTDDVSKQIIQVFMEHLSDKLQIE